MEESTYEAERRERIEANQAKLRALDLSCGGVGARVALYSGPRAAPPQRKRTRPAEQVHTQWSRSSQELVLAAPAALLLSKEGVPVRVLKAST